MVHFRHPEGGYDAKSYLHDICHGHCDHDPATDRLEVRLQSIVKTAVFLMS